MAGPKPAPRGRVLRRSLAVAGFAVLAALVWLASTALHARSELEAARAELPSVEQQLLAGQDQTARLESVGRHAQNAYDDTHDPLWALAARVPIAGRPLATLRGLTEATRAVSVDAVLPLAQAFQDVRPTTVVRNGTLDVQALRRAVVPLTAAAVVLDQQRGALRDLDGSWVGPLAQARTELARSVDSFADTAVASATAARLLPGMFGADEQRRWFVAFQNPAEARGTGGLLGAYVTIVADGGKLRVERSGADSSLPAFTSPPQGLSADFVAQYGGMGADSMWLNSNLSPDFPEVASTWAAMWKAGTKEQVDSVVALDPKALAAILAVTGPVTVNGVGEVNAGNVENLVLLRQYQLEADPVRRKQIMVGVGTATIQALLYGKADLRSLTTSLAPLVAQRRVQLWSGYGQEQDLLGVHALTGAVDRGPGPFAEAIVVNAGGNKLDTWLHESLTYQVLSCRSATRSVEITVTLRNDAPRSGLPAYVTVRSDKPSYKTVPGQSRVELQVLTTLGSSLTNAKVDGVPVEIAASDGSLPATLPDSAQPLLFLQQGTEGGRPSYGLDLELLPGQSRLLTLHLDEPASALAPGTPLQPMVQLPMATALPSLCGESR